MTLPAYSKVIEINKLNSILYNYRILSSFVFLVYLSVFRLPSLYRLSTNSRLFRSFTFRFQLYPCVLGLFLRSQFIISVSTNPVASVQFTTCSDRTQNVLLMRRPVVNRVLAAVPYEKEFHSGLLPCF